MGLIGWYGHSNYGDERILYCIKKFFSDHELFVTSGWDKRRIDELNQCDYILIGGGGLIVRGMGKYHAEFIDALKRPFGLIGVSVEAKHKSMNVFLDIIKQRAEFILVRDLQSKKLLNNHYKVIVGPDLTFLYPFGVVSEVNEDICGFNLRDWYYWKATFRGRYHNAMQIMDRKYPSMRRIYPFAKWNPDKAVEIVKRRFKDILPLPLYFKSNVPNDVDILSRAFEKVPFLFSIDPYQSIRFLVGMRFHSIVFATQCGIPFISLSYQPKNSSFCADMGLDMLSVDIYKIHELESKIDCIKKDYQEIRERLLLYREKCAQEIRYIFESISRLIC